MPTFVPTLLPWQWLLGATCAFLVGVAKTGVPGFGILVVPLMVLAVGNARASAGWLLPLLCAGDLFAVIHYRRHAEARRLFSLLPWVIVGMAAGTLVLRAPEPIVRRFVAAIILLMIAIYVTRRRQSLARPPEGWRTHVVFGGTAGFATMVANAAGPVMNVYLLAKRLPKEEFVATGAWFFLVVNLSKVPVYAYQGLVSARSLAFDLLTLPLLVAGALSGRRIVRDIPQRVFEFTVLALTVASALLLLAPPPRP
ncbi:MAG TPA: sulfite exporter TauE/SafE family protein [Polyangiaceae bacterium]|nr:sulfite exporter TauE/SafE family protein [Polyangiaceae bacterium]